MSRLFSYVLRYDGGAAPNPFWGTCTLTICKGKIRAAATVGDWIVGTGSANAEVAPGKFANLSDYLIYAMRIDTIMSLKVYDRYCQKFLREKIPTCAPVEWPKQMGDCIYDFSNDPENATQRPGIHTEDNRITDLGGKNALLSEDFYYYGTVPRKLDRELDWLIKKGPGHKIIDEPVLFSDFEAWLRMESRKGQIGEPQLKWYFENLSCDQICPNCSASHLQESQEDLGCF